MTRPHVVRADTIDLQDPDSPSAKDHSRQPMRPSPDGAPAPHQATALKHVELEINEQHGRSPRASQDLSGKELQLLHDEQETYSSHDPNENLLRNSAVNGGGVQSEEEDETSDDGLDDDLADKISSSPSIGDDEDIDFEFVYALHTFVATVEGQANATKGDTMVLLDDSNSYWWLVRVVKDSSIGYLPAEHIETPLERLARLNKHRNLDLSQTMLGDQDEEKRQNPLNPLKKAMRRRNTKKVDFSPTNHYLEPSDVEYPTDDEDDTGDFATHESENVETHQEQQQEVDDAAVAEVHPDDRQAVEKNIVEVEPEIDNRNSVEPQVNGVDPRPDDLNDDLPASKSRKGTVRNTDSFFRDETLETRKINLTPNLLRDDSNGVSPRASGSTELKTRASLDSLEKDGGADKSKDDNKKKKEKRGMLGGMFKRKDKKTKGQDREFDEEKTSAEMARKSPTPKESMESLTSEGNRLSQPHRQSSKLQKQPPGPRISPKSSISSQGSPVIQRYSSTDRMVAAEAGRPPLSAGSNGLTRLDTQESRGIYEDTSPPSTSFRPIDFAGDAPAGPAPAPAGPKANNNVGPRAAPPPPQADTAPPVDVSPKAPQIANEEAERERREREVVRTAAELAPTTAKEDIPASGSTTTTDRLSESPVHVSPPSGPTQGQTLHQPPPLVEDTSSQSQEDTSSSPPSPTSSPELIEAPEVTRPTVSTPPRHHIPQDSDTSSPATQRSETTNNTNTTTRSTPTWSDASLRAYMNDDTEIRDLLILVNDKSGVVPRKDHPVVQGLFRSENQKLGEMEKRLDGLLGEFLGRRAKGLR